MNPPLLLDLFCKAGGAARGYADAGWQVVGVDIEPQPNYPYSFVLADALEFLTRHGHLFDAVHASPPCQDHSSLRNMTGDHGTADLLPAAIDELRRLSVPWVVENVDGPSARAHMPGSLILCGSSFGLGAACRDGKYRQLRRHRRFLSNVFLWGTAGCVHQGEPIGVYGTGAGRVNTKHGNRTGGRYSYRGNKLERSHAMGIDWMSVPELSHAIPPAYTRFVGEQIMAAHLRTRGTQLELPA